MLARTLANRFSGSGSLVARSAMSIDTRFWYSSASSPVRTLIGTPAMSESSGSAPCFSR